MNIIKLKLSLTNLLLKLFNCKRATYQPMLPPDFVIKAHTLVKGHPISVDIPLKLYLAIQNFNKINGPDKFVQIKKQCEKYFPVSEAFINPHTGRLVIELKEIAFDKIEEMKACL